MSELLRAWWGKWRAIHRERAEAARGFDRTWLRWPPSLLLAALALLAILACPPFECSLIGLAWFPGILYNVLLCAYFGDLLFRRLHCGLLEWIAIAALLACMLALVFTTPGLSSHAGVALILAPPAIAWVFWGAATGTTQARLLGVAEPVPRLLLLAAGWFSTAAPAFLMGGVLLWHYRRESHGVLVSGNMAFWIWPFLLLGIAGLLVHVILSYRAGRTARAILQSWRGPGRQ